MDHAVTILDPQEDDAIFGPLEELYAQKVGRRGIPPDSAGRQMRVNPTVAAAMLLQTGQADAAIIGGNGDWMRHWHHALDVVGKSPKVSRVYALSAVIVPNATLFFVDTHLLIDPSAAQIAEMTILAAAQIREFGITPRAALLSHSSFGNSQAPSAKKMREALRLIQAAEPGLEVDGEMHADAALLPAILRRAVPSTRLTDTANLLVMPNLDSANIAFNLLKAAADGLQVGPLLLGMNQPIEVLVSSVTARGIVNVTAAAVAQANG
jgi:malate dehydrogenase (oxaloacetate-decarboxylating)(NADP+)